METAPGLISIFDKRLFVFVELAALFRFLNLAIGVEFLPQYNFSIHDPLRLCGL
jgi:hypothetical protein